MGRYLGVFPSYFYLFFFFFFLEVTVQSSDTITLRSEFKGIQLMFLVVNQIPVNATLISTT